MSSSYSFNATITRDSLSTPWGFRLEGGRDFQSPLTIQRVFQGSPAAGILQRGDIIVTILHRDAKELYHQEANELIKRAGGSLNLTIRRGQPYPGSDGAAYTSSHSYYTQIIPISPAKYTVSSYQSEFNYPVGSYVYDPFARPYETKDTPLSLVRNRTIEKIHDPKPILSQTGSPIMPITPSTNLKRYRPTKTLPLPITFGVQAPIQPAKPVQPYHEKQMIDKLHTSLSKVGYRPRPTSAYGHLYPSTPNIYQLANNQVAENNQDDYSSLRVTEKIAQFQQPHDLYGPNLKRQTDHVREPTFDTQYQPPWSGTLKPASSKAPAQHQHQQQQQGPNIVYSKHEASDFGSPASPLKVLNNQYNTPIGLYSKTNINAELNRQVGGLPSSDF